MISSKDRSGYFGASDTKYIVGNWENATFKKWWMEKLGLYKSGWYNKYTMAGTYYEHKILDCIGDLEKDKQIIIPELCLRVNLDGNTNECIYEVKTYKSGKAFKPSKAYIQQTQVQMFATGLRKAYIIAYPLTEKEYKNFFLPVHNEKIVSYPVEYDSNFIENIFLPRIKYLSQCMDLGIIPRGRNK